jgi:predicted nucleotidyltransferase
MTNKNKLMRRVKSEKIMTARVQEQIDLIRDIILDALPVEKIYLFGSYAYGVPNSDSDLDFYGVIKDDVPYKEIDAEDITRRAFFGKTSMPTDVLVIKKSRFDYRLSATTLEREVANKGVLLYG